MYKLVVFDLDGTLANTLEDLANATNYGLEKAGLKTYPVEDYKQMVLLQCKWSHGNRLAEDFR